MKKKEIPLFRSGFCWLSGVYEEFMSYNITDVKEYENNLQISKPDMKEICDAAKKEYPGDILHVDLSGNFELHLCEMARISGVIENDLINFKHLGLYGEGSGNAWHEMVKPMLKRTKGNYKARFVWEGGDSITMVTCRDGVIIEKELE